MRLTWLVIGFLLGALWSPPLVAQSGQRLFATLSANLSSGASTPVVCAAAGAGCVLLVQVH